MTISLPIQQIDKYMAEEIALISCLGLGNILSDFLGQLLNLPLTTLGDLEKKYIKHIA